MGYSMAKVAALFCIALLVAHADGARMLKQVVIAETHTAEDSALPPPVGDEVTSVPVNDIPYNYAAEDESTSSTELASDGFLVPSPPDSETITEDADVQDEGTDSAMFAVEEPALEEPEQEGTLWQAEDSTSGSDGVTTASLAEENNGGTLVDSSDTDVSTPPYDFDATAQDAEAVFPAEGAGESLASLFESSDSATEVTSEEESPNFVFDESNTEFGN